MIRDWRRVCADDLDWSALYAESAAKRAKTVAGAANASELANAYRQGADFLRSLFTEPKP